MLEVSRRTTDTRAASGRLTAAFAASGATAPVAMAAVVVPTPGAASKAGVPQLGRAAASQARTRKALPISPGRNPLPFAASEVARQQAGVTFPIVATGALVPAYASSRRPLAVLAFRRPTASGGPLAATQTALVPTGATGTATLR